MESHYTKIVRWSDEDHCYIGTCPDLMFGGVHGANELRVYKELCKVVAEWQRLEKRRTSEKSAFLARAR